MKQAQVAYKQEEVERENEQGFEKILQPLPPAQQVPERTNSPKLSKGSKPFISYKVVGKPSL